MNAATASVAFVVVVLFYAKLSIELLPHALSFGGASLTDGPHRVDQCMAEAFFFAQVYTINIHRE